jgi:hypothetical protein
VPHRADLENNRTSMLKFCPDFSRRRLTIQMLARNMH